MEVEATYKLNANQELFCLEYIKDRNQTKAYIRAGYSEEGAPQNADRLMNNDYIRWRINELILEQINKIKIEAQFVLTELLKAANVDIKDAYNKDGTLKNVHDMPEPLRKAIAEITTEELFDGRGEDRKLIGYTKKIRLWDKTRALELLGKHLKMFADVHEVPGLDKLAERMAAADVRTKQSPGENPT